MSVGPYSFRALSTYQDNYAYVSSIPNFSEAKAFSLECQFYLRTLEEGILVSHGKGFCLFIKDGNICYSQGEHCNTWIVAPATTDCFITVTVSFDSSIWKGYIDGFLASRWPENGGNSVQTAVYPDAFECGQSDEGFVIGKNIEGYFSYVRLYKDCLSDDQVQKCACGQLQDVKLYAWLEFTDEAIVDKGPSAVEICAKGMCCQYTFIPCLFLAGRNYAYIDDPIGGKKGKCITILGKISPSYCSEDDIVLYSNCFDLSQQGIQLHLIKSKGNGDAYFLLARVGGVDFQTKNTLKMDDWTDFAISVSEKVLSIYLNEKNEKFELARELNISSQGFKTIGALLDDSKMVEYETAMLGYVSFIAEFDTALSSDQIQKYMENPPFCFDPGLSANYTFFNRAVELVSGRSIGFCGNGGGLALKKDARADVMPKAFSVFVPKEEDPAWKTYSKDEQWQIAFLARILEDIYANIFYGKTVGANIEWFRRIAGFLHRITRRIGYQRLMEMTPDVTADGLMRWLHGSNNIFFRIVQAVMAENVDLETTQKVMIGLAVFSFVCGMTKKFIDSIRSSFEKKVDESSDDRPDPDPTPSPTPYPSLAIRLQSIQFDNKSDGEKGGIHIKSGIGNKMDLPEWKTGRNSETNPALVAAVREDLKTLVLKVVVKASIFQAAAAATMLYVEWQRPLKKEKVINESASFQIKDNEEKTVEIELDFRGEDFLEEPAIYSIPMYWKFQNPFNKLKENMGTSYARFYFLPKKPIDPFVCEYKSDYDESKNYPPVQAMEIGIECYQDGKNQKGKAANDLDPNANPLVTNETIGINNSVNNNMLPDYVYDNALGASRYVIVDPTRANRFKLNDNDYIRDASNISSTLVVNCMDCAFIVQYLCKLFGGDISVARMTSVAFYFETNQIIAIGNDKGQPGKGWNFPFNGGFSYHAVNADYSSKYEEHYKTPIYDACLKLDYGQYPSQPPTTSNKVAEVPVGLQFSNTFNPKVDIHEPYTEQFYRERLVKNQTQCELFFGSLNDREGNDTFNSIVEKRFKIADEIENLSSRSADKSKKISILPPEVFGQCYVLGSKEELKQRLTQMLSLCTSPYLEKNTELGIGELCYVVHDKESLIIFIRNMHLAYLGRKVDGYDLFAYAKTLDKSWM